MALGYQVFFPVDRERVVSSVPPVSPAATSKLEKLGVPLYSPYPKRKTPADFSQEELAKFEKRFEEGYDLTTDERYNLWLKINHPSALSVNDAISSPRTCSPTSMDSTPSLNFSTDDSSSDTSCVNTLPSSSVMQKVIGSQKPSIKVPQKQPKTSGRVLTSDEQLKAMREKEMKKREEEERKAKKRAERGIFIKMRILYTLY